LSICPAQDTGSPGLLSLQILSPETFGDFLRQTFKRGQEHMEQLVDVLQLAGFIYVIVTILVVLTAVAIGLEMFLYMTDRKIVMVKNAVHPHDSGTAREIR